MAAKFQVGENIGFCKTKHTLFGYANNPKEFVVCTKNIKAGGYDLREHISTTVYHESVHAAQFCKGFTTLGIPKKDMDLPQNKIQDARNSVKVTRNPRIYDIEYEAYWLEDKPELVAHYLKKFCL